MSRARSEIVRFLIVGGTTVLIDLAAYRLTMFAGLPPNVAKAVGFLTGSLFAFVANRIWTFDARNQAVTAGQILRFAAVYGGTLVANVAVNGAVLMLAGLSEAALAVAFVLATGVSATLNFVGMKMFVFRSVIR